MSIAGARHAVQLFIQFTSMINTVSRAKFFYSHPHKRKLGFILMSSSSAEVTKILTQKNVRS